VAFDYRNSNRDLYHDLVFGLMLYRPRFGSSNGENVGKDGGRPMRTWTFRETGEIRKPKLHEWINEEGDKGFYPVMNYDSKREYPILSLEAHDEDPMEPIKAVYEKNRHLDVVLGNAAWCADNTGYSIAHELWQATKKAVGK